MLYQQVSSSERTPHFSLRLIIAVTGLLCLFGAVWAARSAGLARLAAFYSVNNNSLGWANSAVNLCDVDPEAYFIRGLVLTRSGKPAEATKEFERAIALRPRDYLAWLELGRARDEANDQQGALIAFNEAVRLAPYYAQPRWQRGQLLLKAGRRDEAFADLRRAVKSDTDLLAAAIELAWKSCGEDVQAVEQAIQPQTVETRLAIARSFLEHGKMSEAIRLFRAAGDAADEDRRGLIYELLAAKQFARSYEVWASGLDAPSGGSGIAAITDGSFESKIELNEPGFGWKLASGVRDMRVTLATDQPRTGARSLRIDWNGNSDPSAVVASQLVLVNAKTRYRLSFEVRTEEVVTGGVPMITVTDVSRDPYTQLQTKTLPQGTSGWRDDTVEFATLAATSAVRISIQRENCSSEPCPIFGRVWLDDFLLKKS